MKPTRTRTTRPTHAVRGATNVRNGPSTDCGINGVAGANNKADYHCYVTSGDQNWTYLRFKDTHYGFVRDGLLSDNGSYVAC